MTFYLARRSASALVIMLACIVIISILLIAYLSEMQLDRIATQNYSQGIKTQEIAFGAFEEILGDLAQEIDAGSLADPGFIVGTNRVFFPTTNAAAMPARIGFAAGDYAIDVRTDKLPPSFIRASRAQDPFYMSPPAWYDASKLPPNRASAVSTALTSANRRTFNPKKWNKPRLFGADVPTVFSASPPDWVYVTRSGSRVCGPDELAILKPSADLSRTNQILGRYAYVIYDEGGLLDVTIAGTPSSATNSPAFKSKSYLSFADLTRIPGLSQAMVDKLVLWRNKGALAASSDQYTNVVFQSATNGFLRVHAGDNPFLSRQDLIQYMTKSVGVPDALPYLGTFSRARVAPSWKPATPAGSSIEYSAQAEDATAANRNLANIRFPSEATVTHYGDDATPTTYQVAAGDPLMQSRFSLARLAWLARANPDTGSGPSASSDYGKAIRDCFGLVWGTAGAANGGNPCWLYEGSSIGSAFDGTIKTLAQVASEGREPNFFELLKAAILSGSLGVNTGPAAFGNGTGPNFNYHEAATPATAGTDGFYAYSFDRAGNIPSPARIGDLHIIQIGANIIDQYDADSYPSAISFRYKDPAGSGMIGAPYDASTGAYGPVDLVTGNENLPYLIAMMMPAGTTNGQPQGDHISHGLSQWWQPELWNPHQKPNPANSTVSPPGRFMIKGFGQAYASWVRSPSGPSGKTIPQDFDGTFISFTDSAPTSSAFYDNPRLLTQNTIPNVVATASKPEMQAPGSMVDYTINPFVGFWAGTDVDYSSPGQVRVEAVAAGPVSFCLGWTDSSGGFHPYSYLTGIFARTYGVIASANTGGSASPAAMQAEWHMALDVRSSRFATSAGYQAQHRTQKTLNPDKNTRLANVSTWGIPSASNLTLPSFPSSGNSVVYWEDFAVNQASPQASTGATATYYADLDGVVRPGDGAYGDKATGNGMLLYTSNGSGSTAAGDSGNSQHGRRPIILNRPFRSVGELGYVFRDLPFKTLDMNSELSADAALLDVFTLSDSTRITDGQIQSVTAGWINPNAASATVLEAVLAGASKKDFDANYNLSANDAKSVAQNITSRLLPASGPAPIMNPADVVSVLGGAIRAGLSASADKANKSYAEAPVRALSDTINVRIWNLLIDVVAQSGSLSLSADSLDDFMVQGERRYWLHVAIDRYTGKIIDQQLEPVYE